MPCVYKTCVAASTFFNQKIITVRMIEPKFLSDSIFSAFQSLLKRADEQRSSAPGYPES